MNEQESYELSGLHAFSGLNSDSSEMKVREAAHLLSSRTQNTVIITLGERGTYCLEKDGTEYLIPAVPAKVIDTIGAGDSHIGAILASLCLGSSMKEAIRIANRAAAAVISVKGSTLSPQQFQQWME